MSVRSFIGFFKHWPKGPGLEAKRRRVLGVLTVGVAVDATLDNVRGHVLLWIILPDIYCYCFSYCIVLLQVLLLLLFFL